MRDLTTGYDEINTNEERYLPQAVVLAGKWTNSDTIVNNAPDYNDLGSETFTLVANTDDQVVRTWENKKYKQMWLFIKQGAAITSYDWRIQVSPIDLATFGHRVENTTGTELWGENAIATTTQFSYLGSIGAGVDMRLEADNNHAGTDITLTTSIVLFDPVR